MFHCGRVIDPAVAGCNLFFKLVDLIKIDNMRTKLTVILLILLLQYSCLNQKNINQFSSYADTLILKTEKIKGCGFFTPGSGSLVFNPPDANIYGIEYNLPEEFDDPKVAVTVLDFKQEALKNFLKGELKKKSFNIGYHFLGGDTTLLPDKAAEVNYLSILKADKDGEEIMIVDQNNNYDFKDDTIRNIPEIDWGANNALIEFEHEIFNDSAIITAISWANIGYSHIGENILCFTSQHYVSRFKVNGDQYAIGAYDRQWNTAFYFPRLSLIEHLGIPKDTVMPADIIKPGEYVNLNNNYYRFNDITNDGSYIILIKDIYISKKTGTQVGMKAPDFAFMTINSENISLNDFLGEYIVIANTTMCFSEEDLFLAYKNFSDKYYNHINFICLNRTDSLFKEIAKDYDLKGNLVIISDKTINEGLDKYRPDVSSRECFLINPEGYIIDKFNLFDWESHLEKIKELNN